MSKSSRKRKQIRRSSEGLAHKLGQFAVDPFGTSRSKQGKLRKAGRKEMRKVRGLL